MESECNYITKYEVIFSEVHPSINFVPKHKMLDGKHIVFYVKAAAIAYIKEIIEKVKARHECTVTNTVTNISVTNAYTKTVDDYTTPSRDNVITLDVTHEKTLLLQAVIRPIQILKT